jgi:hypothetical protein
VFNLFSAISGKFSTSIITGTFFPVLLFLSCFVWIVQPVAPGIVEIPALFRTLETQSLVLAITFALALLTGILSGVNHLLIRYYANAKIPGAARFHADRVQRLRSLRDELDRLGSAATGAQLAEANDAINPILTVLAEEYPADGSPSATRLGNVFGNREGYFKQRYGISHAVGWWRLAGAMDPTFAGLLDDSKASFDFMLNSSFLALLTMAALLAYAACFGAGLWPFGWRVALFALTSRLAYLGAVDRAKAMGYLERAAIDLFRLSLLTKVGFKYDFASLAEERAVWASLEVSLTTPDRSDGPPYHPDPVMPPAATSATSEQGPLTVLRAIRSLRSARYPSAEIELAISDPLGKAHTQVQVTDALMPSWSYVAGSAASGGVALTVTGTAPFAAALGPLAAGAVVTVTYRCQAWKAGSS